MYRAKDFAGKNFLLIHGTADGNLSNLLFRKKHFSFWVIIKRMMSNSILSTSHLFTPCRCS